jgi:hypothetical protein
MPGEYPFFIEGKVVEIMVQEITIVKVPNGNLYHLRPSTPGIDYYSLRKDDTVIMEVTSLLTRVLSAKVVDNDK